MDHEPTNPITKALVIGAGGMLGRAWVEALHQRGIEHTTADLPGFDLLDPDAPDQALRLGGYSHVLNAAAWTDVDGAEASEPAALELNAAAVARLANACAANDCHLVHISTDYVFAGNASAPYPTDAPHDPINAYGRTKAAGEATLFDSPARWTLIRTSWLYGSRGSNFVRTMLRLMSERDEIRVVDDQRGRPTSVRTLARATLDLLEQRRSGVWHATDRGDTTWHGLATRIGEMTGSTCKVVPCTSGAFPRPAPRPAYSVLDISETERVLPWLPKWDEALAHVLTEIAQHDRSTPA